MITKLNIDLISDFLLKIILYINLIANISIYPTIIFDLITMQLTLILYINFIVVFIQ